MKRHKIAPRKSKRMFTRGAMKVNKRNLSTGTPMRGGIRM